MKNKNQVILPAAASTAPSWVSPLTVSPSFPFPFSTRFFLTSALAQPFLGWGLFFRSQCRGHISWPVYIKQITGYHPASLSPSLILCRTLKICLFVCLIPCFLPISFLLLCLTVSLLPMTEPRAWQPQYPCVQQTALFTSDTNFDIYRISYSNCIGVILYISVTVPFDKSGCFTHFQGPGSVLDCPS